MTDNSSINRYVHVDATNPSALLAEDTEARAQIDEIRQELDTQIARIGDVGNAVLELVEASEKRATDIASLFTSIENTGYAILNLVEACELLGRRLSVAEEMLGIISE